MNNLKISLDDMKTIVDNLPDINKCQSILCSIFIPNKAEVYNPMASFKTHDIVPNEFQQLTFIKDYGLNTWVLIDNNIIKPTKI